MESSGHLEVFRLQGASGEMIQESSLAKWLRATASATPLKSAQRFQSQSLSSWSRHPMCGITSSVQLSLVFALSDFCSSSRRQQRHAQRFPRLTLAWYNNIQCELPLDLSSTMESFLTLICMLSLQKAAIAAPAFQETLSPFLHRLFKHSTYSHLPQPAPSYSQKWSAT